jgi:two-component system nitrate/nitrite response regulator NarL
MAASLRIVLADDHAPTRLGVRRALERADFEIVAEADDAQGAIQAVLEHRPDLCLLDIYMPGGGINAAARLSEAMPELPIVMLTASSADDDLFEALRAGACGYLLKDTDPRGLARALRAVLAGEAPLPRTLTARLIAELQQRGRDRRLRDGTGRIVMLSEREAEVLALLRAAHTTNEMAQRLAISPTTVRRHVSEILRKLQVADRAAAVRLASTPPK